MIELLSPRAKVPNRWYLDPSGSETKFWGVQNAIFVREILSVLLYAFFQNNRELWNLASAITLSSL